MTRLARIGTDFEKFVHDGDKIASAIGLIGGDKEQPLWVPGGNLQEDNVLAEAAVNPCETYREFLEGIKSLDRQLEEVLPFGYSLVGDSTHHYTREFLEGAGSNALRFGCSAELDAWNGEDIYAPSPYTTLRTAGGHIHFSYHQPTDVVTLDIIRCMDYALGAWSVLADTDRERRSLYGRAGSCRLKPYGGEYRVLSNFWIEQDSLVREVYNRTKWCVENHGMLAILQEQVLPEQLCAAINNYDEAESTKINAIFKEVAGL